MLLHILKAITYNDVRFPSFEESFTTRFGFCEQKKFFSYGKRGEFKENFIV